MHLLFSDSIFLESLGQKKSPACGGAWISVAHMMPTSSHLPPRGWNKIEEVEVKTCGLRELFGVVCHIFFNFCWSLRAKKKPRLWRGPHDHLL